VTRDKPVVTVNSTRYTSSVGGEVSIRCVVEASEDMVRVQWIRADGRTLSPRSTVLPDHTLILRRIGSIDEGRYICVAVNRYGRSQAEVELVVSGEA